MESGAGTSASRVAGTGRPDEDGDEFGLFDDSVAGDARNPYPELAQARRDHPVQRLDASAMPHDEALPVFFVYRFEDIARVLRDSETFSSGHIIDMIMGPVMGEHIILGMDGERHRRYRALVSSAFRQKVLAESEDQLVAKVANELIDRFADRGRAELVREFTFPYPTQVIAGILGLPREDYKQFQRWSIAILSFLARQDEAIAASREVEKYMAGILANRRRAPQEDLISRARPRRDRRREAERRRDLLLSAPAPSRRSRDDIPIDRKPPLPAAFGSGATGGRPFGPIIAPSDDRGGIAPRGTSAQHHATRDQGHADRRYGGTGWLDHHVDARGGQPR